MRVVSKLPTPHNTLIWAFWVAKPIFVRTLVGPTLTCLKSVPRSDTRKERFRRSLRVPRKERQSRSCHGMGKFIFFYFFSFSGIFLDGWFSARAKIMGLPLIRVDSTFVLGYCSYFGMHTLTLVIKFANIFEKWFFFKKSCCRCL